MATGNSIIPPSNLRFYPVNGQAIPCEGPRGVPLTLDFTQFSSYTINLQNLVSLNFISMVQSVFVDNSNNGSSMTISNPSTGQNLVIPANSQAYLGVLCPNPAQLTFTSTGTVVCYVALLNYPVTNCVWDA